MTIKTIRPLLFAAALLSFGAASAQEAASPADPHAGHSMAPMAADLPAGCTEALSKTETKTADEAMKGSMGGKLEPVQAANMAAMELMHGPMMKAAMIEDADLAFNCGMIAHHQGAIAMAKVELEHGKDAASRALAERVIAAQEKEIEAMSAWVAANAK